MFKDKFAKLIDVKSIVTIIVISVFSYLAVVGKIEAKDFMIIVSNIITFYFTHKATKEGVI